MPTEGEEDGTCSICQDLFRDPRILPCSHTFCRTCLTGHILASQRRTQASDSFLCPLCNAQVSPSDPLQHRFFWARQFPINTTVEDIVAKLSKSRDTNGQDSDGKGGGTTVSLAETRCHRHAHTSADGWCQDHDQAACKDCVTSLHKHCPTILSLPQAATQRKQEVETMRSRLELLKDSFKRELENLTTVETSMRAMKSTTLAEIESFHQRMTTLLADKREELRWRVEQEHALKTEGVGRKREVWEGMVEEIGETSVVAEFLYMEAGQDELLTQFAPLKQQFDNLQYIMPALVRPQASRWELRDKDACLRDLRALTLEESQTQQDTSSENPTTNVPNPSTNDLAPYSRPSSRNNNHHANNNGSRSDSSSSNNNSVSNSGKHKPSSPGASSYDSPARDIPNLSGNRKTQDTHSPGSSVSKISSSPAVTGDRRADTLGKIKRRRQRLSSSVFSKGKEMGSGPGGVKASQVQEYSASLATDQENYGLGDICLLHPRDVLLVAFLNSCLLRVFFLTSTSSPSSNSLIGGGKKSSPLLNPLSGGHKHSTMINVSKSSSSTTNLASASTPKDFSTNKSASTNDISSTSSLKPSVCELTHNPCCLAQMTGDIIVATSSNTSQISFVRITTNAAKPWRSLEMNKHYRAVGRAGTRSLVLATYHSGDKTENVVDLLEFDEDFRTFSVLRTLTSHPSDVGVFRRPLFRAPHCVWVTKGGEVVLSDGDTPAVMGLKQDGHQTFLFKSEDSETLDSPAGLAVNAYGEIYVADACLQGVLKLSSSGQYLGQVLGPDHGLQSPVALALGSNGKLYVGDFYGGIKVFVMR